MNIKRFKLFEEGEHQLNDDELLADQHRVRDFLITGIDKFDNDEIVFNGRNSGDLMYLSIDFNTKKIKVTYEDEYNN